MEPDRKEMDRGGRDPPVWEPLLLAVRNTMRPTSEAIRSLKKSNKISKKKRQNGEKRNATELFCFVFFLFFSFFTGAPVPIPFCGRDLLTGYF